MSKLAWLTVDTLPSTTKILSFIVPNDDTWLAQLRGALTPLIYEENYEEFGEVSPRDNADWWRCFVLEFFEEKTMFTTGMILPFGGNVRPDGWLFCDGNLLEIIDYPDLFAVIGWKFGGWSEAETQFRVPNFAGKFPVGFDANDALFDDVGRVGGEKTHVLSVGEIPSHTHTQNSHNHTQNSHNHTQNAHDHTIWANTLAASGGGIRNPTPSTQPANVTSESVVAVNVAATAVNVAATAVNQSTGGGGSHNNLPPFLTLNFIIKT